MKKGKWQIEFTGKVTARVVQEANRKEEKAYNWRTEKLFGLILRIKDLITIVLEKNEDGERQRWSENEDTTQMLVHKRQMYIKRVRSDDVHRLMSLVIDSLVTLCTIKLGYTGRRGQAPQISFVKAMNLWKCWRSQNV